MILKILRYIIDEKKIIILAINLAIKLINQAKMLTDDYVTSTETELDDPVIRLFDDVIISLSKIRDGYRN